jgi:hypothetical protein
MEWPIIGVRAGAKHLHTTVFEHGSSRNFLRHDCTPSKLPHAWVLLGGPRQQSFFGTRIPAAVR